MSDKPTKPPPKNIPKDGQVILAIMKEMGITEYEPKTIVQLTEFVYRYATSILEEARIYTNNRTEANSKHKTLDVDDIKLALQLTAETSFTTPPPREVILECASQKNYSTLPAVKPHCGLRLPPDRYCLSSCNYTLKSALKKTVPKAFGPGPNPVAKMMQKQNSSFVKRGNQSIVKQTVTIPKPLTKVTSNQSPMQMGKPKIQITQNIQIQSPLVSMGENSLKRKREEDMM